MDKATRQTAELHERGEALALLQTLLRDSETTCGQIALIAGEAGVGKSSLLQALAAQEDGNRRVAWGQCDDLFAPRQLGPVYDLATVLGPSLIDVLERGGPQSGLFPQILAAINELPAGSLLIIEDVHWADHATLDLLNFMARRLLPLRVLVVLTYRPDGIHQGHPLTALLGQLPARITTRLSLDPLSAAAVAAIASEHGQDADELYRVTGGNPFFLSELLIQPLDGGQLPLSIRDAVLSRAARLNDDERELLDLLSVSPEAVPVAVADRLIEGASPEAIAALEYAGLFSRDRDDRVCFRHELARLAVLDALPAHERRRYHRCHLDIYLTDAAAEPSLVVHHAAALESAELLLQHAPRAARRAAALGACREAAAYMELALAHVDAAEPEQAARLYEEWAYETSLFEVSERVVDARREAVRRWRELNRPERVGDNLRWLWRLYWYLGDVPQAEAAATESLAILESIPPSLELTSAYALRAHMNLLRGQRADCILWGKQALAMAPDCTNLVTQTQVRVTLGTAMLFDGDEAGRALIEEALAVALENGFHEEAARVYTNYSEYAIVTADWSVAERMVREGLAFDVKHGLDAWTTYLRGRHAQLYLGKGDFAEAETLATAALDCRGQTPLMRLPANTVLAIVHALRGHPRGLTELQEVLDLALTMQEQQRITPARLALIQYFYLDGDLDAARQHVVAMREFGTALLRPWDAGAVKVWESRLELKATEADPREPTQAQALELAGDFEAAAALLESQQRPLEAAMARLAGARSGKATLAAEAERGFAQLGCPAGQKAAADISGIVVKGAGRRGPYKAARKHPLGLTRKEVEVLALMAEGASNLDIAGRLSRSPRTIEHHVSSILGKLDASNRLEATLRVIAEPWIAQS